MAYQPALLGTARLNNFRLNYLSAALRRERDAYVRILVDGVDMRGRVLYQSVTITDRLNDDPNDCALTFYGAAPHVGQSLRILLDSNAPRILFTGELQTVDTSYRGRPETVVYPAHAVDDMARANRRRPLMVFTDVSASIVARTLIETYAPGFSTAGVEADLPPVSVIFDGSEAGLKGCLTQVAKLIGGYWYFEDRTLYLFLTAPGTPPDPIDDTPGRFLHDPPITRTIDKSQVRTRVYGKGMSTTIAATVDAGAPIVAVREAVMFNPLGGQAIAGTTPDGAASEVLRYTGVQAGGGGGLVGPGAAPSAVPALGLRDGAGVESGRHEYAITFLTAAGESLPGPRGAITVGPMDPPASAPVPGAPTAGGAMDPGTYVYVASFVTAIGETAYGAVSAPVTIGAAIPTAPTPNFVVNVGPWAPYLENGTYRYAYGYQTAQGSTIPGPVQVITMSGNPTTPGAGKAFEMSSDAVRSSHPSVTHINVYRTDKNLTQLQFLGQIPNSAGIWFVDSGNRVLGAHAPTVDTSGVARSVPLTGIPIGGANVTARRIYRWNGIAPAARLVTTIANNTATTFTDTLAQASLGADAPTVNTALANQVAVALALGGSGVTGRKVYRSIANGSALLLVATVADNITTQLVDSAADATLGAAAPLVDTSGLAQPSGQVGAGGTVLIVANAAAFALEGGWAVIGNGEQVIRYAGRSANSLTGIPPTGSGAIVASVSYNSTVTASPALVGVTGLTRALLRASPIHVWVQRDDLAAQAYMASLDGHGDGVYEHIVHDDRRSETSLAEICDAQLAQFSRPIATVRYACRDPKTKSGQPVAITLATPAISETLVIHEVTIAQLGVKGLRPTFTVQASSVRQSFEAVLRMLIRKADA